MEDTKKFETLSYKPHPCNYVNEKVLEDKPEKGPEAKGLPLRLRTAARGYEQAICDDSNEPNQNLMIILEIECLISQVNEKIAKLALNDLGVDEGYSEIMKASEEIDLFQKTKLFELRRAFE